MTSEQIIRRARELARQKNHKLNVERSKQRGLAAIRKAEKK